MSDEAEVDRLKLVIYQTAHLAASLGSGSDGWLRGRFMSISNALSASIGRTQSSHGNQYDSAGNIVREDPLNDFPPAIVAENKDGWSLYPCVTQWN